MASKFDSMRAATGLLALSTLASSALAFPKMNHVYPSNAYGSDGVASAVTSGTSYVSPGTETEGDYGFASSTSIYSTSTTDLIPTSSSYPSFTESSTEPILTETAIDLSSSYTATIASSETGASTYDSISATPTSEFLPVSTGGFEFSSSTGTYSTVYPTETSTCNEVAELDPRCTVLFPFVGQNDLAAVCELFLQGPGGCDCGSVSTTYGGYYPSTTAPFPYGNTTATGGVTGTGSTYASPTTTFELGGVTTTFSSVYASVTPILTGSSGVTFDDLSSTDSYSAYSTDSYIPSDTETYSASVYASSTYTSTSAYSASSASYAAQPTTTSDTDEYTYSGTHMKRN